MAGGTLAAALAFALRGKPVLRLVTAIAVPLCVFAVFLTLSRGGLVALGASLIAAVVMAGRRRRRRPRRSRAAAVRRGRGLLRRLRVRVEARDRILEVEGGTGRTDIWTVGWRMVEDQPLRGVGAGNFPIASIHYLLEPGALLRDDFIVDNPKVAHNTYLNVLAELGVVGLALFLAVIAFSLWCAARALGVAARAGDRQLDVLARAMIVVLVGLLAADFFGSRQYSKQLWLLLSLCPVLLAISRAELASRRAQGRSRRTERCQLLERDLPGEHEDSRVDGGPERPAHHDERNGDLAGTEGQQHQGHAARRRQRRQERRHERSEAQARHVSAEPEVRGHVERVRHVRADGRGDDADLLQQRDVDRRVHYHSADRDRNPPRGGAEVVRSAGQQGRHRGQQRERRQRAQGVNRAQIVRAEDDRG